MLKVLLINGSPHPNGCIGRAFKELEMVFKEEQIETEIIQVGNQKLNGCMDCKFCKKQGRCVFDDCVNEVSKKFESADGIIIGSPVYYASANGTLISFLDRLFYSSSFDKTLKVGAAVVSARRGGNSATFDELNKYFTINSMPVAASQYWNMVHGFTSEDVEQDLEGLQTMRTLARNMAFLMKSIALGKEKYGYPKKEPRVSTHFIK